MSSFPHLHIDPPRHEGAPSGPSPILALERIPAEFPQEIAFCGYFQGFSVYLTHLSPDAARWEWILVASAKKIPVDFGDAPTFELCEQAASLALTSRLTNP